MSATVAGPFQRVTEKGWRRGLGNLLQGEYSAWFKSSRWWKHLLTWCVIINGLMGIMIYQSARSATAGSDVPPLFFMYGIFGGMFVAFGVMVIMQRVLVREKQMGTAAWVLSKPVTRTAFVVSRLAVNALAILLTSVVVPGLIFYLSLGLFSDVGWLSPFGFAAGLAMVALHSFFWISLVLMMGTLWRSSSGVIAVPMILYFALWNGASLLPSLIYVSPLLLTFSPAPEQVSSLAAALMAGEPVFSWWPFITTVVACLVFVAVAIRRFNRQEF